MWRYKITLINKQHQMCCFKYLQISGFIKVKYC